MNVGIAIVHCEYEKMCVGIGRVEKYGKANLIVIKAGAIAVEHDIHLDFGPFGEKPA